MKKLLAVILSVVLLMSVASFAAADDTVTLTFAFWEIGRAHV